MQPLNVLVVGEGRTLPLLGQSKFLNKLYLASNREFSGAISINFNTFRELAVKCKALKIDIVIVEDEKLIQQGITDVLRKNLVNGVSYSNLSNTFTASPPKPYRCA